MATTVIEACLILTCRLLLIHLCVQRICTLYATIYFVTMSRYCCQGEFGIPIRVVNVQFLIVFFKSKLKKYFTKVALP